MPGCLHESGPVRAVMADRLHPGGPELTRRGLELAGAKADDLIMDAGCGPGGSLRLLRSWGYERLLGLDRDLQLLDQARDAGALELMAADLNSLPISDHSLDLVLCECAWNLSDRTAALDQFRRVLVPGGRLIISDIYNRAEPGQGEGWPLACCFAGAGTRRETLEMMTRAGLRMIHWEDHSAALRQLAAELILAHGSLDNFWQAVTGDAELAAKACRAGRQSLPGYFLLIAEKV